MLDQPAVNPAPNSYTATATTAIAVRYSDTIDEQTVSTQTFAVYGMQSGLASGSYQIKGGDVRLTPTHPFHPGELVQATVTTGTRTLSGQSPLTATVWQFRIAATAGSGRFRDSEQLLDLSVGRYLALGDVDGDHDLDAFIGNDFSPNTVWINDGTGHFQDSGQRLGSRGDAQGPVLLGDLDGDGDLDVFVSYRYEDRSSQVWLNDGTGHFLDSGQRIGDVANETIELGDLDGDGDLDVFACQVYNCGVLLNDGAGHFSASGFLFNNYANERLALGDIDGDGDLDAIAVNSGEFGNARNILWVNNGHGFFEDSRQTLAWGGSDVALGDIDGDGDLDVAIGAWGSTHIWINNGTGRFTATEQQLGPITVRGIAFGDLDADGDLDLLLADRVWLNDGFGNFHDSGQKLGIGGISAAALGDVDNNGSLDVYMVKWNAADEVWLNTPLRRLYLPLTLRQ